MSINAAYAPRFLILVHHRHAMVTWIKLGREVPLPQNCWWTSIPTMEAQASYRAPGFRNRIDPLCGV